MTETKSIEKHFADWESEYLGYGYGTGEEHTLGALKAFMGAVGDERGPNSYRYTNLEQAVTPPVAWLLIGILVRADVIEYGTSPRGGWLTENGIALRDFLAGKSVAELEEIVGADEQDYCTPTFCNCGPKGYSEQKICRNPFWPIRI